MSTGVTDRVRRLYERPFWGRRPLVERVSHLLAAPGSGVILVGSGGAGKTSVAIAALRALTQDDSSVRVVHVTATPAARVTPLGAFLPVMEDFDPDLLGGTTESIARAILTACAGPNAPAYGSGSSKPARLVLHIDDSPDLDPLSARVLDHLIARTDVRVLITCRSSPGPSAELVRAVRDEMIARVQVPDMTADESADFIGACTAGLPVAPDTVRRMHELTGGNALFLSELIRSLQSTGDLFERHGLWVWESPLPLGTSLSDLLRAEYERLDDTHQRAFEIAALAAPSSVDLLLSCASADALFDLADDEWISIEPGSTSIVPRVTLTQPLYGEAILDMMPAARARRIHRDLHASAVARFGMSERPWTKDETLADLAARPAAWSGESLDLLTAVRWGVRGGADMPLSMLLAAFRYGSELPGYEYRILIASAILRHPESSALLRAAALVNRAEAHRYAGAPDAAADDVARCRALLDAHPAGADRMTLAVELAIVSADSLVLQQGRWREALEMLDWAASAVWPGDAPSAASARRRLDAARGIHLAYGGRTDDALALCEEMLKRSRGTGEFLPLASTMILLLAQRGESKRTRALARSQLTSALTSASRSALAAGEIFGTWCLADMFLGHQREATFIYSLMNSAIARNPGKVQPRKTLVAFGRGLLALIGADWPGAIEHLSIAGSELDDFAGTGSEGLLLASLTLALAAGGDPLTSRSVRARYDVWANGTSRLLEVPSRYFLLLASLYDPTGDEAVEARALADLSREMGFAIMELRSLHALALSQGGLSASDLQRVDELAARTAAAPISAPLRDNCRHIAGGEGPVDSESARRLARCGLMIPLPHHRALTPREQQLAELIALGYSNAQIATRLVVSRRTIESHAASIFAKLGVTGRDEIAAVIDPG